MKFVLLSGGSGKRLWPLSNQSRSKQFLKLLPAGNGTYESMVQRVYRQIHTVLPDAEILVTTSAEQSGVITAQLGNQVRVLVEPERRDTFPAIMLAASYLASEVPTSPNESIVILPIDPCADNSYFHKVIELGKLVENGQCHLALLGIAPTYPSEKYGYILPQTQAHQEPFAVQSFREKPNTQRAQELIRSGAYWNAGVFAAKLDYLLGILQKHLGTVNFPEVQERYPELEKTSFDYAVVEHEKKILFLSYHGKWKDLGTWNTLTEEIGCETLGSVVRGEGCEHTFVINELSVPVVALGMKNAIIAASPDGILVSDLGKSAYMKPYVDQIEQRPMFEERKWGNYKVLDYTKYENGLFSLTKHLTVEPNSTLSYQSHKLRDEIWTIVDGTADLLIDGHIRNVRAGDVAYIAKGQKHSIRAITTLHFIEVQIGTELIEEDITRYEWVW